jgi:two-component system chemotaxis sensor kinase CheA
MVAEISRLDSTLGARLRQVYSALERGISDMQSSVTAMRMVPIGPAVRRLPRLVRDVSEALGRDVDFALEGEHVECDKGIADAIYEPLLHLIRNAIDHGIEAPDVREAAGKPSRGTLRLRFSRSADRLIAELEDDGAGIDPVRVRQIAVERGLISGEQARDLTDEQAQALIFAPGFSTAARVTDISGRGVGMDAVKAVLDPLGARIDVRSRVGHGTLVRVVLPLSVITTRMLVVEAGRQRYAVPFESVAETVIVSSDRIVPLGDRHAVVLRGRTLPVVHLRELLGEVRSNGQNTKLMVAWAGNEQVAVAVDDFGERIEATIKPAPGLLAGYSGLSGVTTLGTGDVMLVLDVEALVA